MSVNELLKTLKSLYRDLYWGIIGLLVVILFFSVRKYVNLQRTTLSESVAPAKIAEGPQYSPLTSSEVELGLAFASKIRTFISNDNAASDQRTPSGATDFYDDESRRLASFVQTEADEKLKNAKTLQMDISIRKKNHLALVKKRQSEIDFVGDEADVMHYLAAYFAHGYTQPDKQSREWRTSTFGPVSLSSLISFGALERSNSGLGSFREAITSTNSDRVGFAIPRDIPNHGFDVIAVLRPAQGLIIKYQEILVEKGLLAP